MSKNSAFSTCGVRPQSIDTRGSQLSFGHETAISSGDKNRGIEWLQRVSGNRVTKWVTEFANDIKDVTKVTFVTRFTHPVCEGYPSLYGYINTVTKVTKVTYLYLSIDKNRLVVTWSGNRSRNRTNSGYHPAAAINTHHPRLAAQRTRICPPVPLQRHSRLRASIGAANLHTRPSAQKNALNVGVAA